MGDKVGIDAVNETMAQLWVSVRDLYIATLQYGDVGTEHDLQTHLNTGNHLTDAQHRLIIVAFNESFLAEEDDPRRL